MFAATGHRVRAFCSALPRIRRSDVKPGDTQFVPGGLRDFDLYRDLGIAEATNARVIAHLVKANMAPETGTRVREMIYLNAA